MLSSLFKPTTLIIVEKNNLLNATIYNTIQIKTIYIFN